MGRFNGRRRGHDSGLPQVALALWLEPRYLLTSLVDLDPSQNGYFDAAPSSGGGLAAQQAVFVPYDQDLLWLRRHFDGPDLGAIAKLDPALQKVFSQRGQGLTQPVRDLLINGAPYQRIYNSDGARPLIDVYVEDVDASLSGLKAAGLQVINVTDTSWQIVEGYASVEALAALGAVPGVIYARAVDRPGIEGQGAAPNQWESVSSADALRQVHSDADGSGIDIGVISDTMDRVGGGVNDSQATGDLPPDSRITIIDDNDADSGPTDEGRAMAELIFDMGSGFDLLFHTGTRSASDMAGAYDELRQAGADVIVDDISWFSEPVFQDGVIDQAIDAVYNDHDVLVFGSAGNSNGKSYNAVWKDTDHDGLHEFGATDEAFKFQVNGNKSISFFLHWNQGWFWNDKDLVIEVWNSDLSQKLNESFVPNFHNVAFDILNFTNDSSSRKTFNLVFRSAFATDATGLELQLYVNDGTSGFSFVDTYAQGDRSITPNHKASRIFSIGAAPYFSPDTLEGFSSTGPM